MMACDGSAISLASSGDLPEDSRELLHAGNSIAQPDIYRLHVGDSIIVAKTFEMRPAWIRHIVGRFMLRHEFRILRQLELVQGVPIAYGMANPDCLCMEEVSHSRTLGDDERFPLDDRCPPVDFFQKLKILLANIHSAGIAHGDIRRRNILRDSAGHPHIIDFATAVSLSPNRVPFSRSLYRILYRADQLNALKLQEQCHPGSLTAAEEQELHNPPVYFSVARFLRKRVYRRWIKPRTWRRRLDRLRAVCRSSQPVCEQKKTDGEQREPDSQTFP